MNKLELEFYKKYKLDLRDIIKKNFHIIILIIIWYIGNKKMSKYQRSIRNIYKQYGKNIKAFEKMKTDIPKYTEDLFEKHGLDLNARKPMISIMITRWNSGKKDEDCVDTYEKLKEVALQNDSNN